VFSCPYSFTANRKNKIRTATEAVKDIPNGAKLLVGGKKFYVSRNDVEVGAAAVIFVTLLCSKFSGSAIHYK
jgi:hypothetical protein